jgi:hypothetical protein
MRPHDGARTVELFIDRSPAVVIVPEKKTTPRDERLSRSLRRPAGASYPHAIKR